MGERQHTGWSRLNVIVGIATLVATVAMCWLVYTIGYADNAGFRALVDSTLASRGPAAAKIVVGLVGSCVGLLALALMAWLKYRAKQSNWGGRWREWRRERYVRALVRLAGPVSDDLLEILCPEVDREEDSAQVRVPERLPAEAGSRVLEDLAGDLRGPPEDALRVLQFALAAYESCAPGPCWVSADQVFFTPRDLFPDMWDEDPYQPDPLELRVDALNQACHDLVAAGIVSRYEFKESARGADIWLRRHIGEADTRGEVTRLVREELKRRRP